MIFCGLTTRQVLRALRSRRAFLREVESLTTSVTDPEAFRQWVAPAAKRLPLWRQVIEMQLADEFGADLSFAAASWAADIAERSLSAKRFHTRSGELSPNGRRVFEVWSDLERRTNEARKEEIPHDKIRQEFLNELAK